MKMPAENGNVPVLSDRKLYDLKEEAVRFFQHNRVPEKLEEVLNSLFYERPNDVYGRLSRHFEEMSQSARISSVQVSSVLDSTGNPAIQCKVSCTVRNEVKVLSSSKLSVEPEISLMSPVEPKPSKETVVIKSRQVLTGLMQNLKEACPVDQMEIDSVLRKYVDDEESRSFTPQVPDEEQRTPTPSSGTKKKTASAKKKGGKPTDKPIPPYEPPDKRLQGVSAIPCVSMAVLKAGANFLGKSVAEHLHTVSKTESPKIKFPVPAITVISGGKTSPGKLNITKNVFLIAKPGGKMEDSVQDLTRVFQQMWKSLELKSPNALLCTSNSGGLMPSYEKVEQVIDFIQESATAIGLTAGQDVFVGIECAAHEIFDHGKGKYEVSAGVLKSADEIIDYYRDIIVRYPAIIALIDPLRKEDREQWPKLCETLSEKCFIVGSDALYGSMHNFNSSTLQSRPSSGISVSLGGRVTVSDVLEASSAVRNAGGITIVTSPPGDVCDDAMTDFAVGLNCDVVCFGSPSRGENAERLNRLVELEVDALDKDQICYQAKFVFPVIKPPTPPPAEEVPASAATVSTPESKSRKR